MRILPGQYFDSETGLYYNNARYYDPKTGRYISSDPIGLRGGLNTYTYGLNNPLRYIDPSGLCGIDTLYMPDSAPLVVTGRAFGGLAALIEGVATGNQALTDAALEGLADNQQTNVETLAVLATLGRGRTSGEMCRVAPNAAQQRSLGKFIDKIPANSRENVELRNLPNSGVAAQATSPGRVPGSKAVYEKQIDSTGSTVQ